MTDIAALVHGLGGMAQKQQLVRLGARDVDLTRAVRTHEVTRVRQGWYTTLQPGSPQVRAVRVGGRLTGISAVIAAGGWVLDGHPLHVSVNSNAARLRAPLNRFTPWSRTARRGVEVHWDHGGVAGNGSAVSVGLSDALERVILDEPLEVAVAALDWALHQQLLDLIDFETLMNRLPKSKLHIRDWVDRACEWDCPRFG